MSHHAAFSYQVHDRDRKPAEPTPAQTAPPPEQPSLGKQKAAAPAAAPKGKTAGKEKETATAVAAPIAEPEPVVKEPDFGLNTDPDLDHEGRMVERPYGFASFCTDFNLLVIFIYL